MITSVADVRQRLLDTLSALTPEWSASPFPAEVLPFDPQGAGAVYAVSVSRTTFDGAVESSASRRSATGSSVRTAARIRWVRPLRADAVSEDYAAALDAEQRLLLTALGVARAGVHVAVDSLNRTVTRAESEMFVVGEVNLVLQHRLTLTAPE